MKVNPSANPSASSRPTGKPSTPPPTRGFDDLLGQLDGLTEGEAAGQPDAAAALGQESLHEAQAESAGASDHKQTAEDDRKTPTAAEDAARAAMLPTNREIRPEATAEVTPRRILHVLDMENRGDGAHADLFRQRSAGHDSAQPFSAARAEHHATN